MSPWHESFYCSNVHCQFKTSVPSSGRSEELQVCWVGWGLSLECGKVAEEGIRPLNVRDALCLTCVASFQHWSFIDIFLMNFLCNTGFSVFFVFFWGCGRRESLESRKKSKRFRWLAERKNRERVSSKRKTISLPWLVTQSKSPYNSKAGLQTLQHHLHLCSMFDR